MFNFEHEIDNIKDRYLRYFFAWDYFHDGTIHNIEIINDNDIELIITSNRDWEEDVKLQSSSTLEGYQEFKKHIFDDKYKYICKFEKCKYFNSEILDNGYIYLNGRFKDSAKVRAINEGSRNKYLHLRIQTTGGYIDIVFSKFKIKKILNEVIVPDKVSNMVLFEHVKKKFKNTDIGIIREVAENGEDIDKLFAIQYLGYINDSSVLMLAIKALQVEDAQIAAIWVLGNNGNEDVLPLLFKEWSISDGLLGRHIQDSIEKIIYRNSNAVL